MADSDSRQFKTLAETVTDIVWLAEQNAAWTWVNRRWTEYTGYSVKDALRLGWLQAVHPEEVSSLRQRWRTGVASRRAFDFRCRFRDKAGTYRTFHVKVAPDANKRGGWMATASLDAPAKDSVDQAIEFVLTAADVGFWEWNPTTSTIKHSLRHDQIFGYQRSLPEWTYNDLLQHLLEDTRAEVDAALQQLARAEGEIHRECRIRRTDGEERWIRLSARSHAGAEERVTRVWGIVEDITEHKSTRDALREQQRASALLQAVLETTPDPVYVKDAHGRILMANPAAISAIGLPAQDVLGRSDLDWIDNAEERARIYANDMRIIETEQTEVVEEWVSTHKGTRLYLATKSPLHDREGRVVGLVGISRDITEQKRAEQQVQESESRMRRLFDNAPASIAIFEGPEHRCVYVNRAYTRFVDEREILGRRVREAFANDEGRSMLVRFDRVFHSGEPWVTPQVETAFDDDGCPQAIFHETVQPWLRKDGSVAGVMLMAFDITAEVELRRQVQESGARFRALADNIAQLAWMADERGRIFWYNRRWLDYTGTTLEDMQNSRWQNVHHPDHARRVAKKMSHCLRTGQALEDTFPLRSGAGEYRWFYSQAIPIRDKGGQVTRWFGTHTDVTEQRKAAQALETADRRKNEFLAMLAHELRNPLAPIRYAVEILRNPEAEEIAQLQARETVDRQVAHMARLIDDLLDVSRITSGRIELRKERCDLGSIVDRIVEEYQLSLRAFELELSYRNVSEPLWIDGDATRLTQAIGNLLHNAGKFTEPGGRVSVDVRKNRTGDCAEIIIADTGVGIDGELLSQLFEPFSQAAQTLDRSKGGLGLGLSLVKGLVELHGGTVEAVSAGRGRGSSFTLVLPLVAVGADSQEIPERPEPQVNVHQLSIVIVEDNRDTADSLATLLRLKGHQVKMAGDGPGGIELARQVHPDVVLCDIGLPGGMDGYQVVRKLREHLKPHLPQFFALSGYGQEADRHRARQAGFDRHFVKPVDYNELNTALAAVYVHKLSDEDAGSGADDDGMLNGLVNGTANEAVNEMANRSGDDSRSEQAGDSPSGGDRPGPSLTAADDAAEQTSWHQLS